MGSDRVSRAFGTALRQLREAQELSQEELAHRAKTSQSYLSLLERGRRGPSLVTICLLAKALRISPTELVAAFEKSSSA